MDTGIRIKERRRALGLSAEDVAAKIGVSAATIYRYESHYITNMGIDKLTPIAQALDTTEAYLMGITDDPLRPSTSTSNSNESEDKSVYYLDPASAAIAQQVSERPELKMLFDASKKVSSDDLKLVIEMVERLKSKDTK